LLAEQAKCRDIVDVNRAADSGNTPLHAAANYGDLTLVDILLTSRRTDVNAPNQQADNATALHVAIMHGLP
jgi:ankyrin repeat protein